MTRFGVLGPLRVPDGPAPGPAKHRTLLAALLLAAPEPVPAGRLMAAVWDDRPPASAESVLRVYVSALRKLVAGIRTVPGGGYLLDVAPDDVDCHRFERLVAEARRERAAGRAGAAADGLRAALGLWRGPALDGVESSALRRAYGVPLEELRLTALEERVELDLGLGRAAEVIGELRALVGAHPLRERAWVHLMDALHQAGRRSEALAAYQEARRTLVEELGLEPGAELTEAHRRVLLDAGPPRGRPGEGGTWARRPGVVDELPPDISDFCGRRDALAWIAGTVADAASTAPVHLVLYGPPGAGKSALAVHAAAALDLPSGGHRGAAGDDLPGGRLYASLGSRGPGAVLEDLLRSLGCPDGAVPPALDERVRLYRSLTARRRLLVVLDDAADEAQVRPLLPTGPGSVTLVTSRSSLPGLEAARAYELGLLAEDEAVALLAGVAGADRVRAEPEAARRIVRLCGRLPLALRIAGSRLARKPGWTLDHLAGRLGDERRRLDELSAGDLAVRGSLALGYRGLPDPERRLLRELGAFSAPDFAPWALDADLEPLAEAGLLRSRGLDEAGQERYGWHDLTRLYAAERLAEEDGGPGGVLAYRAEAILERVRRAHAALLPAEPGTGRTRIHPDQGGGEPALETGLLRGEARWLSAERRFLVAAVGDFHRAGLHEAAWRLAFYLTPLFELNAHHDDWHATTATGLEAARAARHRAGEALLLRGLADLHRIEGRLEAAEAALRAALPLAEGLELARVTLRLGLVQGRRAGTRPALGPQAEQALGRALRAFEEAGDRRGRAEALRGLGALRREAGPLEASLAAYLELGDRRGAAEVSLDLARLHLAAGRHAEARRCLERRLEVNRRLGDRLREAVALLVQAELDSAEGRHGAAAAAARAARETFVHHGDRGNAARALLALGRAVLAGGDTTGTDDAVGVFVRAMEEFDGLGESDQEARTGAAEAARLAEEARRRR
ncbi:AfsR/SARP family transcriptional regulator [Nonomuraea coxensis]|uniref:AfsR/SARP family transcriptional regulator n=1 Tax=Nonomuraea coxensis TaxID=404386 RepID=UPI0012F734EB|nr:BTAD domain-containing putative transcriptional regulator [Nonomuraea coxensis]